MKRMGTLQCHEIGRPSSYFASVFRLNCFCLKVLVKFQWISRWSVALLSEDIRKFGLAFDILTILHILRIYPMTCVDDKR